MLHSSYQILQKQKNKSKNQVIPLSVKEQGFKFLCNRCICVHTGLFLSKHRFIELVGVLLGKWAESTYWTTGGQEASEGIAKISGMNDEKDLLSW